MKRVGHRHRPLKVSTSYQLRIHMTLLTSDIALCPKMG
nr:MAG TPA: hypothetical protein [Caudoviricetes sp.]